MICAAASPSADTTFTVERLAPGTIHRPTEHVRVAGGKALNLARAAARLGARPLVVALLPEHGGDWLRAELERDGISVVAVRGPRELRHCLSVFDAELRSLTEFYEPGEEIESAAWDGFVAETVRVCEPGAWLAVCGTPPQGATPGGYGTLALAAAERGAAVAVDASGAALKRAAAAGPALIKVNEAEARAVAGRAGPGSAEAVGDAASAAEVAALARRLLDPTPGAERVSIVTRGARGAVLVAPGEAALSASLDEPQSALYPVGSGDAFLAGLLTAREVGADWEDALGLAVGAGTANAETIGAGVLDRDRAHALADRVTVAAVD
jgi:1-phosphofructokinase family hexose kinase